MREIVTTVLDVLSLLLVAAGVFFLVWPWLGLGSAFTWSGLLIAVVSGLWARRTGKPRR